MSKNSNIIAVTMGDPSGVGTEIAIRAIDSQSKSLPQKVSFFSTICLTVIAVCLFLSSIEFGY